MTAFVSYDQFAQDRIFRSLDTINDFSLILEMPPLLPVKDDHAVTKATRVLYEHARKALDDAGFYEDYMLKPIREGDAFGLAYEDDRYGFRIACTNRNITVHRLGSTLAKFHEWYNRFLPLAQGVVLPLVSHFGEATGAGESLAILRGSYRFEFICFDVVPIGMQDEVRNSEIVRTLLRKWPDAQGAMTEDDASLDTVTRADLNLHRWAGEAGRRRLERYQVEAPANDQGSSIWFTFEYRGETYESAQTGVREPWDAIPFLNEWDAAYSSFLRDRAILGFMASVLNAERFKTTATRLP